jgi:hypothetical protein
MQGCYRKRSETIEKKCSVKGCKERVMKGNYFLCENHYFGSSPYSPLDEYRVHFRRPFVGRRVDS